MSDTGINANFEPVTNIVKVSTPANHVAFDE